jgi:magnesium chelatase family protein
MGIARAMAVALTGTDGHLVTVEADITSGLPATILLGLPGTALRETRDRVRAAVINSGGSWPGTRICVILSPDSLPKRGCSFDLAIAVAVMAADGGLPPLPDGVAFVAELGLDGRLRAVPGVLPAVIAAAASGARAVVIAAADYGEAVLPPGIPVIAAGTLADVTGWLRGGPAPAPPARDREHGGPGRGQPDLANVAGQEEARFALEVCAAGGHHLSMTGPDEAGAVMLAERLPGIMPPLDERAALEAAAIRSAAGMPAATAVLETAPPFCAPHRTSSMAAIAGGGTGLIRPGALSLAHRGVLFLDQAPEFHRDVLDALRQPLETGEVVITRGGSRAIFPARFILVLASGPCPCGRYSGHDQNGCHCLPAARRRYLARLSGPLLDRVDVKVRLQPAGPAGTSPVRARAEPSAVVAQRVAAARERAAARLDGTPWQVNAEVPASTLRSAWPPEPGGLAILDRAVELGQVSARAAGKIAGVAWTLADLAGKPRPAADEISRAIQLRTAAPD